MHTPSVRFTVRLSCIIHQIFNSTYRVKKPIAKGEMLHLFCVLMCVVPLSALLIWKGVVTFSPTAAHNVSVPCLNVFQLNIFPRFIDGADPGTCQRPDLISMLEL